MTTTPTAIESRLADVWAAEYQGCAGMAESARRKLAGHAVDLERCMIADGFKHNRPGCGRRKAAAPRLDLELPTNSTELVAAARAEAERYYSHGKQYRAARVERFAKVALAHVPHKTCGGLGPERVRFMLGHDRADKRYLEEMQRDDAGGFACAVAFAQTLTPIWTKAEKEETP